MVEGSSQRILIVDDEGPIRDMVERSLRQAGYACLAQADSTAAARRRLAEEGPFAVVILDILMPGEPGTALLKELVRLAPQTATIMATGAGGVETAVEALKMGAYDYLLKPLMPDAVRIAVARAMRKRMLEIELVGRRDRIERLVRERTKDLQATRHALLRALCHMAEFRDAETGAHLRRMPEYARVLASDLAQNSAYAGMITDAFITRLAESAPLHDIGKVGVPDSVLLKPGRLTHVELEQVKLHTVRGRDICAAVKKELGQEASSFIDVATEVAYSHHERWDGSGYPEGCTGAEAPLSGRIVHVADFYDACRSPRVYRPEPIPRERVVEMIKQGRGTHFDPEVADAFMRTAHRFVAIEESLD